MPGPIHVFHQSPREREALARDLAHLAFEVRTFESGPELIAANDLARPALVLWDLDVGRVRGGLANLAQNLGCPVVGLTSDHDRGKAENRAETVLLPYERWRVTPLVLRVLSAAELARGQSVDEHGVLHKIRVAADTVRQSIFDGLDAWDDSVRRGPRPDPVPMVPPPLPARADPVAPPPLPVAAQAPAPATPPAAAPAIPVPNPSAQPARVRVLLADDDEVLPHILGYQLATMGWEVMRTGDGSEAEALLKTGRIDILLVDLNLPHRNGFEILEQLRPVDNMPKLRVIVLSEQSQEEKIVRAFDLGAHEFVQKPLNPRVVVSRIARLLRSE